MSKFELSSRLRLFLSVATSVGCYNLGERLPISVRKRYSFSQTMVIYPEAEYQFFVPYEITRCLSLADNLGLDAVVSGENGLPVIEITDYSINRG